jgi:hypothetical protein
MAGQYAKNTEVTSAKSRIELEETLGRYGATNFGYASTNEKAVVAFTAHERTIRFTLPLPDRHDRRFTHTEARGYLRSDEDQARLYEAEIRRGWRALNLVVKAKLEAVESGIVTFEQEFYAHTVMPGGNTLYEATHTEVERAIAEGGPVSFRLELEQ